MNTRRYSCGIAMTLAAWSAIAVSSYLYLAPSRAIASTGCDCESDNVVRDDICEYTVPYPEAAYNSTEHRKQIGYRAKWDHSPPKWKFLEFRCDPNGPNASEKWCARRVPVCYDTAPKPSPTR